MSMDYALLAIVGLCLAAVVYHHVVYPLLLRVLGGRRAQTAALPMAAPTGELPSIAIIVPAYNEAAVIAAKIRNLAALDYPIDKLRLFLVFDGCTDGTEEVARQTLAALPETRHFSIVARTANIGKIAVLNAQIAECQADLVALTDASAIISPDALLRAATHFGSPATGLVCAVYNINKAGSDGERVYWQYQTRIKLYEAALAAPIGAHGAFYMFRRALWQPLPADTINDDFFIPMRIVLAGHRSVYDLGMVATEAEQSSRNLEFRRRTRIGAGNMQQLVRMPQLLNPARGALAFLFISGKGLRALLPFILLIGAVGTLALMLRRENPFLLTTAALTLAGGLAALALRARAQGKPGALSWLGYFLEGHFASGWGAVKYLARRPAASGNSWAGFSTRQATSRTGRDHPTDKG
jgi:cellulose synthase/poly-beta-1,6-N-acetylglucosamine synthase-like glycosyltransferase